MTRALLTAATIGTLTGVLLVIFGPKGAVGIAVCAAGVIAFYAVLAVRTNRQRARDKARHPSSQRLPSWYVPQQGLPQPPQRVLDTWAAWADVPGPGQPGSPWSQLIPLDETARRSARQYGEQYPGLVVPESEWPQ